jgi:hypothetical protein
MHIASGEIIIIITSITIIIVAVIIIITRADSAHHAKAARAPMPALRPAIFLTTAVVSEEPSVFFPRRC